MCICAFTVACYSFGAAGTQSSIATGQFLAKLNVALNKIDAKFNTIYFAASMGRHDFVLVGFLTT